MLYRNRVPKQSERSINPKSNQLNQTNSLRSKNRAIPAVTKLGGLYCVPVGNGIENDFVIQNVRLCVLAAIV